MAGRFKSSDDPLEVRSPYDGEVVGVTSFAPPAEVEKAIRATEAALPELAGTPAHRRAQALERIALGIQDQREALARLIAQEAGKPLRDARVEVGRAVLTFKTAAEEAKRVQGEYLPLDWTEAGDERVGIVRRVPIGPILAITPFNFPLNLVAHKVAPAIAAGNPMVVKPSERTPLTALALARLVAEAGLPEGAVSVLNVRPKLYDLLAQDERFKMLTFTGSAAVGWGLKAQAGRKRVALELGGNAGVIVDRNCDLELAAERIARGGFSYAGQSCISVQRVYVHRKLFRALKDRLVERAEGLRLGDPLEEETDLGPLIHPDAVKCTRGWLEEAVRMGAKVLTGGEARGHNLFEPTVLTDVNPASKVCSEEVFAPLVDLFPFSEFREAVAQVNDSPYGLQAGLFTLNLEHAFYAFDRLEVGGLIVNDVPTWRIDPMPYGGVKASGLGREGPRYAMEEMTERRLMVISGKP